MFRASLAAVLLVACGGSDAIQPDAAPGVVTVHAVYRAGFGVLGTSPVVFQSADGSVVAMESTDTEGYASAVMLPGGSVTIVMKYERPTSGDRYRVFTWLAVKPGDMLEAAFDPGPPPGTGTPLPTARFILPDQPNATDYVIASSCGTGHSVSRVVDLPFECSPAHFYAWAKNSSSPDLLGALVHDDFALEADAMYDLSAESWRAPKTTTVSFAKLPSDLDETRSQFQINLPGGVSIFPDPVESFSTVGTSKQMTAAIALPDVPEQPLQLQAHICRLGACQEVTTIVPGSTDVTLDVGPKLLAWPNDVYVDTASNSVRWTASGARADFVMADLRLRDNANWLVAGPAGSSALQLPVLPPELAEFNVGSTAVPLDQFALHATPGGWDAARNNWFGPSSTPTLAIGEYAIMSRPAP